MSKQLMTGTVVNYFEEKEFGFIKPDEGENIYFNKHSVKDDLPKKNDKVQFEVTQGKDDRTKAINVRVVQPESVSDYLITVVSDLQNTDYDEFCKKALEYANELKKGKLTTSQIRKVYSLVTNTKTTQQAKRLRPQFAYTAGKSKDPGVKNLMELLDKIVKNLSTEQDLNNLKTLLEAIVAYLKYIGVKEIS